MRVNREIKEPLYMQVYEGLKSMIKEKWQEGELIPSERELSTLFEVDRLTVRRALGMIAQEGLVEKIAGLGTRVTSAPQLEDNSNSRNLIFLLPKIPKNIPSADRITEPFNASLFYSTENECKKKGYNLIYTTLSDDESLIEILEGQRAPGILFVSKVSDKFLNEAKKLKIPAVVINNENDHFPAIRPDREKGTYEAIRYLVSLNHRRICFISGIPNYITSKNCFEGFKRALTDSNLDWEDQVIKEGNWTFDGGFKAMKEIIEEQSQLPTAVFACNDMSALGAMEALKAAGFSIPRDISVIGFDDIEQSRYYSPKLTTIRVDTALIARMACQNLFFAIESREVQHVQIIVPTELKIRESTGPYSKE
jgi:GntR family transcriptional regulator, arabinose operon transcriptional repressor